MYCNRAFNEAPLVTEALKWYHCSYTKMFHGSDKPRIGLGTVEWRIRCISADQDFWRFFVYIWAGRVIFGRILRTQIAGRVNHSVGSVQEMWHWHMDNSGNTQLDELYTLVRQVRSSLQNKYVVPRVRLVVAKPFFSHAGAKLWNNLPNFLRSTISFPEFIKTCENTLFQSAKVRGPNRMKPESRAKPEKERGEGLGRWAPPRNFSEFRTSYRLIWCIVEREILK